MPGHKDRFAVITGAGSGIGRCVSHALLADGWTLMLVGRREDALAETIARAPELATGRAIAFAADVTVQGDIDRLFEKIQAEFGRIDMLFNNAGRNSPAVPFDEIDPATWQAVIDVNLTGIFRCAQAAFRMMKRQSPQGGRIINTGSISAHVPRPLSAPYTASKHAITGLTKSLNLDGRAHNIVAGQIDVGNAATDMSQRMDTGVLQPDGSMKIEPRIDASYIGQTVAHMAALPLEANIPFLTLMASKMPLFGRG